MKPFIENPNTWAAANRYSIYPTSFGFSVLFQSVEIGTLTKRIGGGYEFNAAIDRRPYEEARKDFSLSSSNPLEELVSTSFFVPKNKPIEVSSLEKSGKNLILSDRQSGTGSAEMVNECNTWLPYAADQYHLSRDIKDYVLIPLPVMFSDLPNTNGDSLSIGEMLKFKPDMGMQMYKTFRGQPTYTEHDNQNIVKAKGVILDAFLRPIANHIGNVYKLVLLLAYDRTKDPMLVQSILNKNDNAYSVGFYYSSYRCSICGKHVGKGIDSTPCQHTKLGRPTYRQEDGRLVYRKCENGRGFECSSVKNPAYSIAVGPTVYDASKI